MVYEEIAFLKDVAVVMVVAAVVTVIFHKIKLPVILGYIIAGVIVGPYIGPRLFSFLSVTNVDAINLMANLGMVLLIFSIGLEFNLKRLRKVGLTAIFAGTIEILLMLGIGYWTAQLLGWSKMDSIFLGIILSISSTTIVVKSLMLTKKMDSEHARTMVGILIIEDIAAIIILTMLPSSGAGISAIMVFEETMMTIFRIVIFVSLSLMLGLTLIPRAVNYISKFKIDEILVVFTLGLCFGMALFAYYLGFSVAIGAFIMGVIVAESRDISSIVRKVSPIRDVFIAMFFVAMGMLIEPSVAFLFAVPILIILIIFIVGKSLAVTIGTFLYGHRFRVAFSTGIGMVAIGEFSFIIAKYGRDTGIISDFLYPIAVVLSLATALLLPYLMKNSSKLYGSLSARAPRQARTFSSFYTLWVRGLREKANESKEMAKLFKSLVTTVVVNLLIIVIVVVCSNFVIQNGDYVSRLTGLSLLQLEIVVGLLTLILVLIPLLKIAHEVRGFFDIAAMIITKCSPTAQRCGRRTIARILRNISLVIILALAVIVASVILSRTVVHQSLVGFGVGATIVFCVFFLWGTIGSFHRRMEKTFKRSLTGEKYDAEIIRIRR